MPSFLVEDFRSIVDKLNNYMAVMHEGEDAAEDADNIENEDTIKFNDVKKLLKDIADISPTAKVHVIKLIDYLTNGIKGKDDNGGKSKVISKVIDILTCAVDDDSKYILQEISKLVSITEGDELAFDKDTFPKLIVELILLTGEITQNAK